MTGKTKTVKPSFPEPGVYSAIKSGVPVFTSSIDTLDTKMNAVISVVDRLAALVYRMAAEMVDGQGRPFATPFMGEALNLLHDVRQLLPQITQTTLFENELRKSLEPKPTTTVFLDEITK